MELALIYVTLPTLLWLGVLPIKFRLGFLVGVCLAVAGMCYFLKVPRSKLGLGKPSATAKGLLIGLGVFVVCFVGWVLIFSFLGRAPLPLIRSDPPRLLTIVCFYWISALAQEFLMRSFFFYRYRPLLPEGSLVLLNAMIFAFIHIIYGSWISVALSFPIGLFLAWLYSRYPSLVAGTVTHYLFGLLAFAGGLGKYFYVPLPRL